MRESRPDTKEYDIPAEDSVQGSFANQPVWGKKPTPPGYPVDEKEDIYGRQKASPESQGSIGADNSGRQDFAGEGGAEGGKKSLNNRLPSVNESKSKSELASDQRFAQRIKQLSEKNAERAKLSVKKGRSTANILRKSSEKGSDWPYWLAIIVSFADDFIDIADLSIGLGLDQILDFMAVLLIMSTRLFIKTQPSWFILRGFVFILEFIPGVGILPLWSIAAIASYMDFLKTRKEAHIVGSAQRSSEISESADSRKRLANIKEADLERRSQTA